MGGPRATRARPLLSGLIQVHAACFVQRLLQEGGVYQGFAVGIARQGSGEDLEYIGVAIAVGVFVGLERIVEGLADIALEVCAHVLPEGIPRRAAIRVHVAVNTAYGADVVLVGHQVELGDGLEAVGGDEPRRRRRPTNRARL